MVLKNQLSFEKSPYLLQHQHNPVAWQVWSDDTWKLVKTLGRPVFLSVGYATCHWCHVMERESFEDDRVANLLNTHFVPIKVDREERPDIDQIYMQAALAMTGHGGWPLSVFLDTDTRPFFAGTYFRKEDFKHILQSINRTWQHDRGKIREAGGELVTAIKSMERRWRTSDLDQTLSHRAIVMLNDNVDSEFGGFGTAPKFPRAFTLNFLMQHRDLASDEERKRAVCKTLYAMAAGGLMDHLGGGFARYATDAQWLVPHFEKMLYDNALLASAYLEGSVLWPDRGFAEVAKETLDYCLRDMQAGFGGFYCAEDADTDGHEGLYYIWTYDEVANCLSEKQQSAFFKTFDFSERTAFEGKHVLALKPNAPLTSRLEPALVAARTRLYDQRLDRSRPSLDDKILTAWNGLMIAALADGYRILGDAQYLESAKRAIHCVREKLFVDGKLCRRYRDGHSLQVAFQTDYAFLIHGLLHVFNETGDVDLLSWALTLQKIQDDLFWDTAEGGYFFTASDHDLIRKKDTEDSAQPSGNSVAASNLVRFGLLLSETTYLDRAKETLCSMQSKIQAYPAGYTFALMAQNLLTEGACHLVVVAKQGSDLEQGVRSWLQTHFVPRMFVSFLDPNRKQASESFPEALEKKLKGPEAAYVCTDGACMEPTTNIADLKQRVLDCLEQKRS